MDESITWNIIDKYFNDNPNILVEHHIESYNDFFKHDIFKIFKEKGPIQIQSNYDEKIDDYRQKALLYFGGKNGDKIYFGKPIIYDDDENSHYMFPNEARLRNMSYGISIHYDIEVEFYTILHDGEAPSVVEVEEPIDETNETLEDYPQKKEFTNVKEIISELELEGEVEGGAPRKAKKVTRNKRNKKPYIMTTRLSSEMKKATEESLIGDNIQKTTKILEKIYLGRIPIMLQSEFCVLHGLTPEVRFSMGECKHDLGGYFIIQGKEKTIICQEKFADNMLYIRKYEKENTDEEDLKFLYSSEIRSISENVSKPQRTLAVKMVAPSPSYTNKNIVVAIPNVRKEIPLFIVFRALGVISDKAIIEMCLLNLDKYEDMMDLFIPSVHDAGGIMTQKLAIEYIATFTKSKQVDSVMRILTDYFLPHIGEVNFKEKAYFLGYMVFRMLSVHNGLEKPTDRDNFKYKRIELIGSMMYDLFSEYFTEQQKYIRKQYDTRLSLNKAIYENDLQSLITSFQNEIFKERILEAGFKKAFKGNWGAHSHTKRIGVLQDLNRLSFNGYLFHMRKTNLALNASNIIPPRLLHCSQWGYFDPVDTPDGGNIGLHKSLATSTHISRGFSSREPLINWLRENITMKIVDECNPLLLSNMTKVMVNGYWAGSIFDPFDCINKIKLYRRNALLPIDISVTFDITLNTIFIYNDNGRLCRPIFYRDEETLKLSIESANVKNAIKSKDFTWQQLVCGFNERKDNFNMFHNNIYDLGEIYHSVNKEKNPKKLERFIKKKAVLDYIDASESENALIAIDYDEFNRKNYTHMEIHESLILGVMGNQIIFPENNQAPRNMFSCGQSKQACSVYHTNYHVRMDKSAIILNYGQIPLLKTRYLQYFNKEEIPYGENTIVAIMCYSGYNMEDSVLINEGALHRGLFNTTYYTTYECHEELKKSSEGTSQTIFNNIQNNANITSKKMGYDYSKLDNVGLIQENSIVDDKTILIGMTNSASNSSDVMDVSITPKKGQLGIVDKSFITEGNEGERIAKVRVRDIRIPNLGDKIASRAGQKGTIGMVIKECDMPFTRDGLRPDIIINPHAIPSRMTVGQLIESITGKACCIMGGFGDSTAFINKGSKAGIFGNILSNFGYHSSGNDILYNGMTGEQLESEIFMGPTYYMRLKHMVKDKINYRPRGPITKLTRQPVHGRANDGGLRIGEMERDAIISHGIADFLKDSMMERCDKYKMAICNNSGMIAIYNPSKNLFLSPLCDGPIQFTGSINSDNMHINNVSKYGRNFSIVEVPYSLKLLIQELMAINVQFRIITQENISQIENMSFSQNIENLANITTIDEFKNVINKEKAKQEPDQETPETIDMSLEPEIKVKDDFDDVFNIDDEDDSPDWNPGSGLTSSMTPNTDSPDYPDQKMIDFDKEVFDVNEKVVYKDDELTPKSIWTIIKISPNFITIQRDRDDDEFNPNRDVKVVKSDRIARPGEFSFNDEMDEINTEMNGGKMDKSNMQSGPSRINFTPVINVVTGENNKVTSEVPNLNPDPVQNVPINEDIFDDNIVVKGEDKSQPEATNSINSALDLGNGPLIIKKSS